MSEDTTTRTKRLDLSTAATHPSRLVRFAAARLDPKAYLGLHVTIGLAVAALAIWAFAELLEQVLENAAVVRFDLATMSWMAAHTTPLGFQIASFITRFGGDPVMPALGLGGAFVLWHQRHRLVLACWLAAFFGGIAVDKLLKHLVHRTRPVLAMTRMHETSFSFPSGHTMAATIGYGMLAYVLATYWTPTVVRRRVVYSLAAIVALLVGLSRIYLGMHFPTDVIGGFAAGTAWLAICVTGTRIARQGKPPDPARANTGRGAQAAGSGHRRAGAGGNYDAADATEAAG